MSESYRRLKAEDYWPHFEVAGALNAWTVDSGGNVERARSQAFQLKQGEYPRIEYPEVIDEQHEQDLNSFFQAIGSSNHIDAADAAGSFNYNYWDLAKIGVAAGWVRKAQSKAKKRRKNLSQTSSNTHQCPKMIARLEPIALDLTAECKARLEKLRGSRSDLHQWRLFHEKFGLFVCPIVTFGGALYSDRSIECVSKKNINVKDGSSDVSGEAMFQPASFFSEMDTKFSAQSKGDQSQGSSSTSQTATKAGLWRKIGGRSPDANFQEWIKELEDLTTWRIIRISSSNIFRYSTNMTKRSTPVLLLEMISDIPEMEWVRDCFHLPQHPIRSLVEPAVPRLSRTPHPQSQLAFATIAANEESITLLLFQNSSNHLELVTLGILNFLAESPIVNKQVAPGTPLAIGHNDLYSSDPMIYVFFADESHHLRDVFYSIEQKEWYKGHLHQSGIRIHQKSTLLFLHSNLYCQDLEGNILRIELYEDKWLDPLNLHTKESDPLHKAWVGTHISGNLEHDFDEDGVLDGGVVLYYLSSQGKIVRGFDWPNRPNNHRNDPDMEDPRVSEWQECPWVNTEQKDTLYPDFFIAPGHSKWTTLPIVFRTAGNFLNLCWKSEEDNGRWGFHPNICQTAPEGRFLFSLGSFNDAAYIIFLSQDSKLKMIELDPHISEDRLYVSHRTIFDESYRAKPWTQLIKDTFATEMSEI